MTEHSVVGSECDEWRWTACVTSDGASRRGGAVFSDLPANILGCFIIGLYSSAAQLGLPGGLSVAALNRDHPLQKANAFHVGIRTGFCGSLTTFASWCAALCTMSRVTIVRLIHPRK